MEIRVVVWILLFGLFSNCTSEDLIQKKREVNSKKINSKIDILKLKVLNFKNENNSYVFGLIENNSNDTVCFFKVLDQINCEIDSFQYVNGKYSLEFIHSYISPQKFDLLLLNPFERQWFYMGDLLGENASKVRSVRIGVFWANYNDTSWDKSNNFIKKSKFRLKIDDVQMVDLMPRVKGFEVYSNP